MGTATGITATSAAAATVTTAAAADLGSVHGRIADRDVGRTAGTVGSEGITGITVVILSDCQSSEEEIEGRKAEGKR